MAGMWRIAGVVLLFALATAPADAFGGRLSIWPSQTRSSSSLSIPASYYYYCWPAPTIVPVPDANPKYAAPTAAPPSATSEPPLGKSDPRMPKIIARSADGVKDRCRVGFWNLSGRDVKVTIEGKAYSLPRNQSLTFDMDRQFTWQTAGKTAQIQRVPAGQSTYEVLIRE